MIFEQAKFFVWALTLIAMFGITTQAYAGQSGDKVTLEEVKQEAHDFIQALKAYSADQRDEAIRKAKAALDDLDKRISTLEKHIDESWDKMDKGAREHARASVDALRERRAKVAERYDSLKNSSVDAWGHMKKGFTDAYGSLYDAWEKSEKEFGADR